MYFKYKITYAIQQKTTLGLTALPTTAISHIIHILSFLLCHVLTVHHCLVFN